MVNNNSKLIVVGKVLNFVVNKINIVVDLAKGIIGIMV